jgi:D-3-phosphoglycerate dehydrogenase
MAQLSLAKEKIKVLLLEGIHPKAVENFQEAGYTNIEILSKALPEKELIEKLTDVRIIGIRSATQMTASVIQNAKKLIAIGCFCIGTNQVDLNAARDRGIPVFNAPYSNTRSVAELVLAEMIMLLRGIPEKNAQTHRGIWNKAVPSAHEIRGKRLGIIGYGNIGSQLSIMAEALGMRVIFYDIVKKLPLGNAQQVENLEHLLSESDVVTLHVPETAATKGMIGQTELNLMKQGSVLINASRGTVVDIDALSKALESKKLYGAALDVFPIEPHSKDEPFCSPLCSFDNTILTPHIGGSTMEAQANIGEEVAQKLIKYSDNGSTVSAVNFPEVSLPPHPGSHRLINIHKNVPGILSKINRVFSEKSINITGQYLRTNESIGYVVIDVDALYSDIALQELRQIEGTIRTRVLF